MYNIYYINEAIKVMKLCIVYWYLNYNILMFTFYDFIINVQRYKFKNSNIILTNTLFKNYREFIISVFILYYC
jgi:hypothetical protein